MMNITEYLSIKNLVRKTKIHYARYRRKLLNPLCTPNPNPIFILGNQKSGTTAIAALLAHATKQSVTLDMEDMEGYTNLYLHQGKLTFQQFINRNRYDFSKTIIKEPWLTFYIEELKKFFPQAVYVFIVRDPRENIRSILNRLQLPGNLTDVPPDMLKSIKPGWQLVLKGDWMGLAGDNYIEVLAHRWNKAVDVYLQHKDQMFLVKYEEFVANKEGTIHHLAQLLQLPVQQSIRHLVDKQFQPKGKHSISLGDFFGEQNLNKINSICKSRMVQLGYK